MWQVEQVRRGLEILQRIEGAFDGDGWMGAEHDIIYYCNIEPDRIPVADVQVLDGLGWYWDDDLESWYHFV